MATVYRVIAQVSDGLLRVHSEAHGMQLWTRVKLRKDHSCEVCKGLMLKGVEAFSPITNGYNRMHRMHRHCFRGAADTPKNTVKTRSIRPGARDGRGT